MGATIRLRPCWWSRWQIAALPPTSVRRQSCMLGLISRNTGYSICLTGNWKSAETPTPSPASIESRPSWRKPRRYHLSLLPLQPSPSVTCCRSSEEAHDEDHRPADALGARAADPAGEVVRRDADGRSRGAAD